MDLFRSVHPHAVKRNFLNFFEDFSDAYIYRCSILPTRWYGSVAEEFFVSTKQKKIISYSFSLRLLSFSLNYQEKSPSHTILSQLYLSRPLPATKGEVTALHPTDAATFHQTLAHTTLTSPNKLPSQRGDKGVAERGR